MNPDDFKLLKFDYKLNKDEHVHGTTKLTHPVGDVFTHSWEYIRKFTSSAWLGISESIKRGNNIELIQSNYYLDSMEENYTSSSRKVTYCEIEGTDLRITVQGNTTFNFVNDNCAIYLCTFKGTKTVAYRIYEFKSAGLNITDIIIHPEVF